MLTSNLARVAVIVAGIAVCIYAKEAIYTFLITLFQMCLACTLFFLIIKGTRHYQRQHAQRRRESRLLKEQETVTTTIGSDLPTEGTSSPDEIRSFVTFNDTFEVDRKCETKEQLKNEDKNTCEGNSCDNYVDIIKYETVTQKKPETTTNEEDTKQEDPKEMQKEKDTIKKEPKEMQKEEDTIKEEPNEMQKKVDAIKEEPKEMQKEEDTITEEPKEMQKGEDTIKEEPKEMQKKEDTIKEEPKEMQKEEDTMKEEHKEMQKEDETIKEEPKKMQKKEDAIKEEPKEMQKEEDTIKEEPKEMQKEEDTMKEEHKEMQKEEDTIKEEPKEMQKEEDTIKEEPKKMQKKEDTITEEPKDIQKEENTIKEEPKKMQKKEDTITEEPKEMQKEEDTMKEEHKEMQKEEDTIKEEPKEMQKEEDTIKEEPKKMQKKEDTIKEEPKEMQKEEDTIKEEPKKMQKKEDTITEEPKEMQKEEDTMKEKHKEMQKEEDTIKEEPKEMQKEEDTMKEEPKEMQKAEDTIKEEHKTTKKEESTVQEGHYWCKGSPTPNNDAMKCQSMEQLEDKDNINKNEVSVTKQEDAKSEATKTVIYDKEQCNDNANVFFENKCISESVLERLNLKQYYPNKLKLMDVMTLRDSTNPLEISSIALRVAMKIIMINYTARDEILLQLTEQLQEENTKPTLESSLEDFLCGDDDADSKSINPLDLLFSIFKCSSPMLQQVLADKLFKCKLAIPFVHPPFDKEHDLLTLWPLRSIMIECKTEKGSLEYNSVDCPCHVVSFVRLGRPSVSKSKLMNEIISDQYHNTFFNKDCPLGTSNRVDSEGMVEASWFLPSKNSPHFDHVTMFLNLRGDGKQFLDSSHNLSQISNVVVVLLHIDELSEDPSNEFIRYIITSDSKICLAVDAGMNKRPEIKNKIDLYRQQFTTSMNQPKLIIVAMTGQMKSISTVKTELRKTISDLAHESNLKDLKLSKRVQKHKGNIDEQNKIYVNAEHAAREVMGHIKSLKTNVKTEVVPLQGKTWQTWTDKMKKSNKSSLYKSVDDHGKLKNDMDEERRKQAQMCNNLSPAMSLVLDYLQHFLSCNDECLVFILFLKQMLDERSRNILPEYLSDFQTCWRDLKSARDKNTNSDVIKVLREKLDKSEQCLAEASFGFEHFCREMGQIYESLVAFQPQNKQLTQLKQFLPELTVQLLLMGLPFEIMDGDVANVPIVWVTAVLNRLKENIGDKKLLTLSVLGIQSSGKSTLLNTMFGLQFAVSAGRCTRGVFMQLVPVSRENSLYDFLLVIDTEGLRAPELAHQKHSHDNELATFVIGLGDITIMNIKGENTAEMKDILQIAVHASLRLKLANDRFNLTQSCVFIHQNVPAFDANDKMMQGRQKFVEELDMMTKEAAGQENIATIQSFNQVIEFDSETNVWYFSDLWRGDPPMAPANPGYSDKVSEVKESIVARTCKTRSTYLTITDTISRISDLWNGIVKDDFVFSFRNSLELKAYNSLEQMCQDVSWKLEKQVLEFVQTKARSRLVVCKSQTELERAVSYLFVNLQKEINEEVERQIQELDAFIDQNSLKDVMIQWVQNKRLRLKNNAEILVMNAKKSITYVKDEILVRCKTTEEKTKHEMEINALAKSLAVNMKGQKPKEEDLQNKFNEMWCLWIKKFPSTQEIDIPIDLQIESTLCEKFPSDATFITKEKPLEDKIFYQTLRNLEGSLKVSHIYHKTHLSIHKLVLGTFWKEEKKDVCVTQTVDVMNNIFRQIDNIIQNLRQQDIQFDIAYVTEILTLVVTGIEDHNKHEKNDYKFNLLPSFRAMIINHVVSYVKVFFTKKNLDYNRKHSPKAQMEEYKGTAWILFKSTVQNKTDDVIAVGLFRQGIMKMLVDHIDNLIPIDVSDLIFKQFGNGKHGLIIEILTELANKEDFDKYFKFIRDPNSYTERWLTKLCEKKLFRTTLNKQTMYAFLVEARALKLFEEIEKCIVISSENFDGNISDWINKFVCEVNSTGNLPLSVEMFLHVKNTPVRDIKAFVDLLSEEMVGAKEEFLNSYKKTTWSTVMWKENPMSRIMKRLWGCTEFCMFCHEPCKEMSPEHWELDKQPHRCVQHRPNGLSGFRNTETQVMAIGFCNFNVGSDRSYIKGTFTGPYKHYKNHFPSWDILPNANASDYWKWVTCKFKENFVQKYHIEAPDIPENWESISKPKAIESLSTLS